MAICFLHGLFKIRQQVAYAEGWGGPAQHLEMPVGQGRFMAGCRDVFPGHEPGGDNAGEAVARAFNDVTAKSHFCSHRRQWSVVSKNKEL